MTLAESRPAPGAAARGALHDLHTFLSDLLVRYRAARRGNDVPESLVLAEAALRHEAARADAGGDRPIQIAVLGPTQTGKSTVVNLLLGRASAEVSPLAGFTVHAQGFWTGGHGTDTAWLDPCFPGCRRVAPGELRRDELDAFCLSSVDWCDSAGDLMLPCVIWDTPDFDSLAAGAYRGSVYEAAALADAHVVVLSKEKYADLAAWKMLRLLAPLRRPMVICLNKLTPDGAEAVRRSLLERLAELAAGGVAPELVTLPLVQRRGGAGPDFAAPEAAALRHATARLARGASDETRMRGLRALLGSEWDGWLAPIRAEHAALGEWERLCRTALDELLRAYRRDYLEHPHRYDSFRRATAELLNLLELPGLGGVMTRVRGVVSWPARKLMETGERWWRGARGEAARRSAEEGVLMDATERLLTHLQCETARRAAEGGEAVGVWRGIAARLQRCADDLRARFRAAAGAHHELIQREIHETAGKLYEALKQHPAMLVTLRTARFTADAASIAISIKLGGAHLNDLLFAPAMFGLMSLLTEGAMGAYMLSIADELRERQYQRVRTRLVETVFAGALREQGLALEGAGLFGLSVERVRGANESLHAWGTRHD